MEATTKREKALSYIEEFGYDKKDLKKHLNDEVVYRASQSIEDGFMNKIDRLKNNGQNPEFYERAMKAFKKFSGTIPNNITPDYLNRFRRSYNQAGHNTQSIYLSALKTIVISIHGSAPMFKDISLAKTKSNDKSVHDQSLHLIFKYNTHIKPRQIAIDFWKALFMMNGAYLADFLELRHSNIKDKTIEFYRVKTRFTSSAPKLVIAPKYGELMQIIYKYKGSGDNYILPYYKEGMSPDDKKAIKRRVATNLNRRLRYAAKDIGVDPFTLGTARHTFGQIMKESGLSVTQIGDLIGNNNDKATDFYLSPYSGAKIIKLVSPALESLDLTLPYN